MRTRKQKHIFVVEVTTDKPFDESLMRTYIGYAVEGWCDQFVGSEAFEVTKVDVKSFARVLRYHLRQAGVRSRQLVVTVKPEDVRDAVSMIIHDGVAYRHLLRQEHKDRVDRVVTTLLRECT